MVDYSYIEKLASLSSIDVPWDRIEYLSNNFGEFQQIEYQRIIQNLKDSFLDPIISGQNYGQKDILTHLNKLR